jgi:hypothetical protein
MRFFEGVKALIAAIAYQIWLKLRPKPSTSPSTSEAERLDRLRHPSKYLGK